MVLVVGVSAPAFAASPASDSGVVHVRLQENNSTTQHERPAEAASDGDQDALRRWLQGRLSGTLAESTLQITQGQYEAADQILGEEYESYFEKYVNVTGETGEDGSASEQALTDARDQQQEYASLVERYESTYEEYQSARANGNESRARELARRLQELHNRLTQTSSALTQSFERVENTTGSSLANSSQQIQSLTENLSDRQQDVTEATFVETNLSVTVQNSTGSFSQPFRLQGQLRTEENTSLPNQATIAVNGVKHTTDVNADGQFTITYRPITIPTGEQTLNIAYLPKNESVFLGATATVPATVQAVTPTVTVSSLEKTYQFHDSVTVTGAVTVNTTSVSGLPVIISIDNTTLGRATTTANGTFRLRTQLPAEVPAGDQRTTVKVAQQNRAVATAMNHTQMTVAETPTTLSLRATPRTDSVVFRGQLTTETGTPVHNQAITILRNGTQIATVTTDGTGSYTVSVPRLSASTSYSVVYDATNSNLGRSRATRTVRGLSTANSGLPVLLIIAGVALVGVTLLGGGYVYRRRLRSSSDSVVTEGEQVTDEPSPDVGTDSAIDPAEAVRHFAECDPDRDVVVGLYGVVRRAVAESVSEDIGGQTHWEFYQSVAPDMAEADALRTVTQTYELAVYADGVVTPETWAETVTAAEQLVDRTAFAGEEETGE